MHALTVELLTRLSKGEAPFKLIERWQEAGCPDLPGTGPTDQVLTLGHALRRAREGAGLTQRDARQGLAELGIEVGNAMLSRWEAGLAMPDASEMATLLTIYDCDEDQIRQVFALARVRRRAG